MPHLEIHLPFEWAPRPYQQPVWEYLCAGGLRAVLNWPRRHGKDDVCMQHTALAMAERKGNYWYALPEYAQARKAIWDAVDEERGRRRIDLIFPEQIRTVYREQEMLLGYQGSTFQLVGADNFHALVGSPPVGIVWSEYARTDPSAWAYLMPILEKNRGWAIFNSTPYGDNHYRKLCDYAAAHRPEWFYQKLTAEGLGVYSPAQLQHIREELYAVHGEAYGEALYQQEYNTSFDAAIPGSFWGDCLAQAEREGRMAPFAVDPTLPVFTAWDLGRTDDTSIWFYQLLGSDILVFDHHASHGKDVQFYMDLLLEKHDLYHIRYGRHWLPHDARPRTLASGAGSILQQCHEAARRKPSLGSFAIAPKLDVQEGIQAARATFPHCRFHDTRTEQGRRSLKHYHREWDEEKQKFLDVPVHDWASHDADAFRYLALTWKLAKAQAPRLTDAQEQARMLAGNPGAVSFGILKEQHLRQRKAARELVA